MTEVKTLIRSNVQHARVISLNVNDVYKRLNPGDTYNKPSVVFGVVTDILANGDKAAIMAIEYTYREYSDVDAKLVTLVESDDVTLFPADPEEVRAYFAEVAKEQDRKVESAQRSLVDAEKRMRAISKVLNSTLTAPQVSAGEVEAVIVR